MIRRLVSFAGLVVGAVLVLGGPAPAAPPDVTGWWWFAQPSGSPVPVPAPPYVPEDGLYVASNPTGTEALSAVRFAAAAGTTLRLVIADVRGDVRLGACRVTEPWEGAHGGAIAEAPPYDCATGAVPGEVSDDGTAVTFAVGALVDDGVLDVVVVPGLDDAGGTPTFQVAFEPPGDDALTGSATTTTTTEADTSPPIDSGFTPPVDVAVTPVDIAPPPSSGFVAAPTAPLAPTQPAGDVIGSTGTDDGDDSDDSGGGGLRIAGYAVLVGTALAYHRLSGVPDRAPRSLVTFGHEESAP